MQKMWNNFQNKLYPLVSVSIALGVWACICALEVVPGFALPSPAKVFRALMENLPLLATHAVTTLLEAFLGLGLGVVLAVVVAVALDSHEKLYKLVYPMLVISQTVPTIAIAPLLVLWMGYGMAPKVTLIVIVCFFPVAVGLLEAFRSVDPDLIRLFHAMGAKRWQIFWHVKWPSALPAFFAGLQIAVSYAVVGAVISEWLGGNQGLGVYMTRVRKAYAYDQMFAVIILISAISLCLIALVNYASKQAMPWKQVEMNGNKYA